MTARSRQQLLCPVRLLAQTSGWIAAALWLASGAHAGDSLDSVIATMTRLRIVERPEFWREQAVTGHFCDGAEVAGLLRNIARSLDPAATETDPLATLARRKIIWNDSWRDHAVSGRRCDGEYLVNLLLAAAVPLADRELADRFPAPPGVLNCDEPTAFPP